MHRRTLKVGKRYLIFIQHGNNGKINIELAVFISNLINLLHSWSVALYCSLHIYIHFNGKPQRPIIQYAWWEGVFLLKKRQSKALWAKLNRSHKQHQILHLRIEDLRGQRPEQSVCKVCKYEDAVPLEACRGKPIHTLHPMWLWTDPGSVCQEPDCGISSLARGSRGQPVGASVPDTSV